MYQNPINCLNGFTGRHRVINDISENHVFGLDIGSKKTKHADLTVDLDKNVKPTVVATVLFLPFKNDIFERVYFLEVLEHLPNNMECKALAEIKRVLKIDGELILSTPNKSWLTTLTDPAHYIITHRHYKKDDVLKMIEGTGFYIISCCIRGGMWAGIWSLWYYFLTYLFKIQVPAFIINKEDEEYNFNRENGFTIFIKAKKS